MHFLVSTRKPLLKRIQSAQKKQMLMSQNMRKLLTEISKSGEASFLAVLKQFGTANKNLLSFPIEGYTLALDFKLTASSIEISRMLEKLVVGMGGRLYLTKDAVMQEATFKATYPKWEAFELVREKYGAIGKFSSAQSKRLGLAWKEF